MKNKLTLNNLYTFFAQQTESKHYKLDEELVVYTDGNLKFNDAVANPDGLIPVTLQACHTGVNLNHSNISDEVMNKALPSFCNRPILGYIHEVDGQLEFYGHNMHLDDDDEMVYDETVIGVIPESSNACLEYDEEKEKNYVKVNGFIYEDYTKASEILTRHHECPVSVELVLKEFSYNAKEQFLNIEDFYFSGVTILGKDDNGNNVNPGMEGSNIQLSNFSIENNGSCTKNHNDDCYIRLEQAINQLLEKLDSKEEGKKMDKLQELLQKYNVEISALPFDYEGLNDEELEAEFVNAFEQENLEKDQDVQSDEENKDEQQSTDESELQSQSENNTTEDVAEDFVKTFSISHEDIRYALYELLKNSLSQEEYWAAWINQVFDNYFVFSLNNEYKAWKYEIKEQNKIELVGDMYKVYAEFLTEDEYQQLNDMRSNYDNLVQFKEEAIQNQKEELLNSDRFAEVAELDSFQDLKKNMANYTLSELETSAKVIHSDYIANNYKKNTEVHKVQFSNSQEFKQQNKKNSYYPTLFK